MRSGACLVLMLLAVGCGDRAGDGRTAADTATLDTADRVLQEGLSRDQIQQSAQPMTPEQAAQMGIIDTTIHVEDQSATGANPLPRPDTTR